MLRRLTLGLFTLASAAAIAACSSGNTTVPSSGGQPGIGPNFATNTVYVSNTTQNTIYIYTPSPSASATPQYSIAGSNTALNGPAYLAFDSSKHLYATNYNASTGQGAILIYQTYATGSVLPFSQIGLLNGIRPQGIAIGPSGGFVVAESIPGGFFPNELSVYTPFTNGSTAISATIAGSNTMLNNPVGVAVDQNSNVYVANSGGSNVTIYPLPTPAPTSSATATPTPSPTPTTSPSGSPAPTPTPSSDNVAPTTTVSCACFKQPTGLTLDGSGDLFVTDPGVPAVYEFSAAQLAPGGALSLTPAVSISGANTKLVNPTDVKTDATGTIYVIDAGNGPNTSMLLIFSSTANGNVAPATAIALPNGTATGMALSP